MSVNPVPSVKDQPFVNIKHWTVYELSNGDRHLRGYIGVKGQGRVTSKLAAWDEEKRVLTTRSGRKYKLDGFSGWDPDGSYIWEMWLKRNNISEPYTDVSIDYIEERETNE